MTKHTIYEQDGKIIVSKLMPMSEAPIDKEIIGFMAYPRTARERLLIIRRESIESDLFITENEEFTEWYFSGWLPMPEYIEAKE